MNIWGLTITTLMVLFGVGFFIGFESIWNGLQNMNEGTGAMLGAFFGLIALLIGALANADLNRKRDAYLRLKERQSLAAAFKAEVDGVIESNKQSIRALEKTINRHTPDMSLIPAIEAVFGDMEKYPMTITQNSYAEIGKLGALGARAVIYFKNHRHNFTRMAAFIYATKDNQTIHSLIDDKDHLIKENRRYKRVSKILGNISNP